MTHPTTFIATRLSRSPEAVIDRYELPGVTAVLIRWTAGTYDLWLRVHSFRQPAVKSFAPETIESALAIMENFSLNRPCAEA